MAEPKHWPDWPIEEVDASEREMLLVQAGPVGENARMAWRAYQAEHPDKEDAATISRERTRLADLGQIPAEERPPADEVIVPAEADIEVDAPVPNGDRADAERRAKLLGLEIRDYGTDGGWRVYDPATGRMVAKSRLEEAPA